MIEDKEKPNINADEAKLNIITGIPIMDIPNKKINVTKEILPIKLLIKALV